MPVQTLSVNLSDDQLKALKDAIDEICVSFTKIDSENEQIKDIISATYDFLKVPKKDIKALAKVQHEQSIQEKTAEFEDFVKLYEAIKNVR